MSRVELSCPQGSSTPGSPLVVPVFGSPTRISLPCRPLGSSALRVPAIGLGCATFGREITEAAAFEIMDYAVEHGVTLFDTAEAYGGGQARAHRRASLGLDEAREVSDEMHSSEKIVGRWLHSRSARNEITLVTKVTTQFTQSHVHAALTASLERLQTGIVDVYLLHNFDHATPLVEAVAAIDSVVKAGFVRAGGCSNFTAEQLAAAQELSSQHGWTRFEVIESRYNLLQRGIELDLLPLAQRSRIGVLAYSPLAAGFLTGKYTPDRHALPPGTRFHVIPGHADIYFSERNFQLVKKLHCFAARIGVDPLQLATAWVFRQSSVSTVLVGARSTHHLANALAAQRLAFLPEWSDEIAQWDS